VHESDVVQVASGRQLAQHGEALLPDPLERGGRVVLEQSGSSLGDDASCTANWSGRHSSSSVFPTIPGHSKSARRSITSAGRAPISATSPPCTTPFHPATGDVRRDGVESSEVAVDVSDDGQSHLITPGGLAQPSAGVGSGRS
jgi:hypothetical protein